MRLFASVCAILAAGAAQAFDSASWLEKRELFAREAERLMVAYSNCAARVRTPAEDVVVPLETFDDGSVKVIVLAKRAQFFLDSGLVWAENVIAKRFNRDGSLEGRVDARNCIFDREARSGWAEGWARVMQGGTTFMGRGIYFSTAESYIKVFDGSRIVATDLKFGGVVP